MKKSALTTLVVMVILVLVCLGGVTAYAAEPDVEELPYLIADGTTYYETASGFGSGRRAIVNGMNPYTSDPAYVAINGFAFLCKNGNLLLHDYDESVISIYVPPAPEEAVRLFLHFRGQTFRNGWVDSLYVTPRVTEVEEPEEPEVEEPVVIEEEATVEDFAFITKEAEEPALMILDISPSMNRNNFVMNTVEFWDSIDFTDRTIWVFNHQIREIQPEEVGRQRFSGRTDVHGVLNRAVADETLETIILISDMEDTVGNRLVESDRSIRVVIFVPWANYDTRSVDLLRQRWPNATIEIYIWQR
ncbi:MAG: hypothetical protein FWC79_02485 [Oscillospiraceae bacterium]|nr:hypothetical protein [Oscillospiraceae bacterium]